MAVPASRAFCFSVSSAVDAAGRAAERVLTSSMASSAYDDFNEGLRRRCADETTDDAPAEWVRAPGHKTPGRRAASTSPPSFDDCLHRGGHSVVSIIRYVIYHAASTGIEVVAGIIIHCRIEPASTGARVERIRFESFA